MGVYRLLAALVAGTLVTGCSTLTGLGGLGLPGVSAPGAALRQQSNAVLRQRPPEWLFGELARMRAVSLSVYNTNRGVAPIISNNASNASKRILELDSDATSGSVGGAGQDEVDSRQNSDGSTDETLRNAGGQIDEDLHLGIALHQTDTAGDDNSSLDLDVKADVSGRTGHYSLKRTADASGSVLGGEIDFRDDGQRTEKTTFQKNGATGHLQVTVAEQDGSRGDLDESDDGQGDVQVAGNLTGPDGSSERVAVTLNKDGTARATASDASLKTTMTFRGDGTGQGEVRDASGTKIGDVAFGRDQHGTLTLVDGTKVNLLVK
jgi:hypothetical protein